MKGKSSTPDPRKEMLSRGLSARSASAILAQMPREVKDKALHAIAVAIRRQKFSILSANAQDCISAREMGLSVAQIDRLTLNEARLEAMAATAEQIAALPDSIGV